MPALFDKTSGNHIILYSPKIVHNTYKCMLTHTHTHIQTDRGGVERNYVTWADNAPYKNHRLI